MDSLARQELIKQCDDVFDDIDSITDTIERHMHVPDIQKKIDIFFYLDSRRKVRTIYNQVKSDEGVPMILMKTLSEIKNQVKSNWQKEFKFLVSPESLHKFL